MKDYHTITIQKQVGCGHIYLRFLEEEEGAFHKLMISGDMAKEAPCGESWLNAIASLLTFALRRSIWEGTTQRAIIRQLCGQRCNMAKLNQEHIVSCSDAIGKAVLEYIKSRDTEPVEV